MRGPIWKLFILVRARLGWRCGELPFRKDDIFGDGVDVGCADSDRCGGFSVVAKLGFDSASIVEAAGYVAIESPFEFGLDDH